MIFILLNSTDTKYCDLGLPWWLTGKESTCQCKRHEFYPRLGKIPHAMEQLSSWTIIIKANRFNYDFANTNVISVIMGFPGGPDGKETTYNARDQLLSLCFSLGTATTRPACRNYWSPSTREPVLLNKRSNNRNNEKAAYTTRE